MLPTRHSFYTLFDFSAIIFRIDFRENYANLSLPKEAKYNSEENSMKTNVSNFTEFRKYYLSEFELYDGEAFITFNLVGIDIYFTAI